MPWPEAVQQVTGHTIASVLQNTRARGAVNSIFTGNQPCPCRHRGLSRKPVALTTSDLLDITRRYSSGPTWSNFTRLLLMQASWGRIVPLGLPPPGQLLAGSVFEVLHLSWGGAKRARTADLLHASGAQPLWLQAWGVVCLLAGTLITAIW